MCTGEKTNLLELEWDELQLWQSFLCTTWGHHSVHWQICCLELAFDLQLQVVNIPSAIMIQHGHKPSVMALGSLPFNNRATSNLLEMTYFVIPEGRFWDQVMPSDGSFDIAGLKLLRVMWCPIAKYLVFPPSDTKYLVQHTEYSVVITEYLVCHTKYWFWCTC